MLDIKLTPFILFMILLVVLVIAMIFGYNNNMVEGLVSGSGSWTKLTSDTTIAEYSAANTLFQVYDSSSNNMYFDPINGNIVSEIDTDYSLLPRSNGVIVDINTTPPSGLKDALDVVEPWSTKIGDYMVLYAPVENSVFVTIIDTTTDTMVSVFKQDSTTDVYMYNVSQPEISIATTTVLPSSYEPVSDLVDAENISINGETKTVYKITKDIYYDKVDGICVKNGPDGTFNTSNDYKTGVSTQIVNTDVLVLSVLINDIINVNVITYDDTANKKYMLRYSIQLSKPTIDQKIDDKISFTIDTGSDNDGYVKVINRLLDERTNGSSSANSAPNVSESSNDRSCSDPRYMLKTEIVPPVCPACPKCPESGCTLSINANGEIIDCNGKKYTSDDLYKAAGVTKTTSSDWKQTGESGLASAGDVLGKSVDATGDVVGKSVDAAGNVLAKSVDAAGNTVTKSLDTTGKVVTSTVDSAGNVISSSVGSAGELLEKTVDTAGNTVTKTIDTAGNTVTKTVDTAGNIINNTIDTTSDLVSGFGQGVVDLASGLGQGAYDLGKGTADVIKSVSSDATGLVSDTGSGFMKLSENRQGYPQQQQPRYPQQQQPGYPPQQQPGYPPQQQPGYDAFNGYGNYQTCTDQGSNYLPITNDFSQFA